MKTNTLKIFILALLTFLVMASGAMYVHIKIQNKINIVSKLYLQEKQNLDFELEKKLGYKLSLIEDQENKIKNSFLIRGNLISFVDELQRYANNNNVEFVMEKATEAKKIKVNEKYSIAPISFTISLKGVKQDIVAFTEEVKSFNSIILIEEFKMYGLQGEESLLSNARIILSSNILEYEN
jgi:Tfp pilus assembly protein PilO